MEPRKLPQPPRVALTSGIALLLVGIGWGGELSVCRSLAVGLLRKTEAGLVLGEIGDPVAAGLAILLATSDRTPLRALRRVFEAARAAVPITSLPVSNCLSSRKSCIPSVSVRVSAGGYEATAGIEELTCQANADIRDCIGFTFTRMSAKCEGA